MKKIILISPIIIILTFVGLYFYIAPKLNYQYQGESKHFQIPKGASFSRINQKLFNENIIIDRKFFYQYAKYKGVISKFRAGTAFIEKGDSLDQIFQKLSEGKDISYKVTIPEGKNLYQIAQILNDKAICKKEDFIKLAKNKEFVLELLGFTAPSFEGYLFPDTYFFNQGTSAQTVIQTLVKEFKRKVPKLSHDFLNSHQVVTLASIVEKETGAAWERPRIAGVYLNRLKKPMRLQADPTTIYGIWEQFDGNLRKKHLLQKTSYNTYKVDGLPLGPIANPSVAAIKAVQNPEKHNYLYFVSKNDGTHIFTPTYKKHLEAVKTWQLNKKNRKGKSWRDLKTN